ncbi:TIGR02611 family protein [Umezawaea endophytica]|uniref:TIGR02611 family protein n=1 Tax=Umezawaea endophytica TaxID=1654476 RepID=A0A9X2VY46_9PSEU|nr:TIGR02611 family protein [Umezawaea endophytica]MCS7484119.1 TIGR02611 family protein [Umezawaea endophytica]
MTTDQHDDTTSGTERDGHEHSHGPRHWFRRNPALNLAYRIGVGVVGGLVLVAGVLMIPYPGPGWLVVFAGLAILATEFEWAGKVLKFAKRYYDMWVDWLKRQSLFVKLLVLAATGLVVLATLWLLGALALVGGWFGIHEPWLDSPIFGSKG